MIVYKQQL